MLPDAEVSDVFHEPVAYWLIVVWEQIDPSKGDAHMRMSQIDWGKDILKFFLPCTVCGRLSLEF